jgi:hypothetical protein
MIRCMMNTGLGWSLGGAGLALHACSVCLQDVFRTVPELHAPRLFGREVEERLAHRLLTGQQRYVELRGGPGEGKTSLACLLAKRLCAQWELQPKTERGGSTAHAHSVELRGEY